MTRSLWSTIGFRLGFVLDPGNGLAVEEQRTVVCKDCFIVTDRNEIAEEEAAALILANESIVDAFFVVVEGFAPSDLSITTANPTPTQLQAWAPAITFNPLPTQMSQQVDDMFLEAPEASARSSALRSAIASRSRGPTIFRRSGFRSS